MRFFREDEDMPEYSPQQESDGLRRLTLLLSYIYHPKCLFLAVDEPELHLHPDMISFLLEEIHHEIKSGKQFAFATHSPEIIVIGKAEIYGYFYFDLKDKLKDTSIIQASDVDAESLIEELGYLLDVSRRAFLYAPVTVFVEGLSDEVVYSKLKELKKVNWSRRVFMVNTGGNSNTFNFWLLWRKFHKDCRVIFDFPKSGDEKNFENIINKFCNELSIDTNLSLNDKKTQLETHKIFIAPFNDVLHFEDKNINLHDFQGAVNVLDFSKHISILEKAIEYKSLQSNQLRKEEEDWLKNLSKELFSYLLNTQNIKAKLIEAKDKLKKEHPNLEITIFEDDKDNLCRIEFEVSKDRKLYINFSHKSTESEFGIV